MGTTRKTQSIAARMMRGLRLTGTALLAASALMIGSVPTPAVAQGQFTPVIKVNDDAITQYELSQRQAFLRLLRAPGDVRELAREQLIAEKLQRAEAERLEVTVEPEAVRKGMEEFAARGNLDVEQLLALLAQAGIAAESFRDFVTAGILWRNVASEKYAPTTNPTQSEIDLAYAEAEPTPGVKFLLTEIVLPASSEASLKASRMRAERLAKISDAEEFSRAAVRFSTVNTRLNGGERDWTDVQSLPPEVQGTLQATQKGGTTRPVYVDGIGVIVYYVRDRETIRSTNVGTLLEYAAFMIPGGRTEKAMSEAARIRAEVDDCDDLYPIARGLPREQLVREELPVGAVPAAYRAQLDQLDPGEVSTSLTSSSGNALVFLMLCNRRNDVPDSVSRDQVANALKNRRIGALANDYLTELRAQANIQYLR